MKTSYFLGRSGGLAVLFLVLMASQVFAAVTVSGLEDRFSVIEEGIAAREAELAEEGLSAVPSFGGGVTVQVPENLWNDDTDFGAWVRPPRAASLSSATELGAWSMMDFGNGDVLRFRLVGRGNAQASDVVGESVALDRVDQDVDQIFSVSGRGIEEFVLLKPGFGTLQALSWDLDLPAGWWVDAGNDWVYIYDESHRIMVTVSAPVVQDEYGVTTEPTLTYNSASSRVEMVYDQTALSGDRVADPVWATGPFQRAYCADNEGTCEITSNGQPTSWGETGNTTKYNSNHTTTKGVYIGARDVMIGEDYYEQYRYTAPSSIGITSFVFVGRVTMPSAAYFQCRVEGYGGGLDAGNWKSQTDAYGTMSRYADTYYIYAALRMARKGTGSFTPNTVDANRCWQKPNDSAGLNRLTIGLVDQANPVSGTPTGISGTNWYKNGDQISVGYSATDNGAGVYQIKPSYTRHDSTTLSGNTTTVCNPAANANAARPCSLSESGNITITINNTTASPGNNNKVNWYVQDFGGRTDHSANVTFKYDNAVPPAPVFLADGNLNEDVDGFADLAEYPIQWTKVNDKPSGSQSGIRKYEYCIGTAVSVSGCTGTVKRAWTSAGDTDNVTATGLSLDSEVDYFACVRVFDKADAAGGNGNMSAVTCSDGALFDDVAPNAPQAVIDGAAGDEEGVEDTNATVDDEMVAMAWQPADPTGEENGSGVVRFQACTSTSSSGTDCASGAISPWEDVEPGMTSHLVDDLSLSTGTNYYSCVRAIDGVGNTSAGVCSDGAVVDETAPGNASAVIEGTGTDVDYLALGDGLVAEWSAASDNIDGSGIEEYEVCMTLESDGSDCGDAPLGSITTSDPEIHTDFPVVAPGSIMYTCVMALDYAGLSSAGYICSDGIEVVGVVNSSVGTVEWLTDDSTFDGKWSSRLTATEGAAVASYNYCITVSSTGSDCTSGAARTWTTTGTDTFVSTSVSLTEDEEYFLCVQSIDSVPTVIEEVCTSAAVVDSTPPSVPTDVVDGLDIEGDASVTPDSNTMESAWVASADSGSGLAGYEACWVPVAQTCTTEDWSFVSDETETDLSIESNPELGVSHKTCIRAIDIAGNLGTAECSDGVSIEPSQDEIDHAMEIRADFGLAADATTAEESYTDPATGYEELLGIPMAPTEADDAEEALEVVETLAVEVDDYTATIEDDPASIEYHYDNGGAIEVAFEENAATHETALDNLVTHPASLEVVTGTNPKEDQKIQGEIVSESEENLAAKDVEVNSVHWEPGEGHIIVGVEDPEEILTDGRTVTEAIKDIEHLENAEIIEMEPETPLAGTFSMDTPKGTGIYDREQYVGGAGITALYKVIVDGKKGVAKGGTCTSAPVLKKGESKYFVMTAAHCFSKSEAVGTVSCSKNWFDTKSCRYKVLTTPRKLVAGNRKLDAMVYKLPGSFKANYSIKDGATSFINKRIHPKKKNGKHGYPQLPGKNKKGLYVCHTGMTSITIKKSLPPEVCGRVFMRSGDKVVVNFRACEGDSGGIIYTPEGHFIGIGQSISGHRLVKEPGSIHKVACGKKFTDKRFYTYIVPAGIALDRLGLSKLEVYQS